MEVNRAPVARSSADGEHRARIPLWDILIALLQLAILVVFLLLLRGCGGGDWIEPR
jgi:hypothetical protein